MALELVDVHVISDDLIVVDIDDVVVRVYDETGTTLITSGTTGDPVVDGHVEFTLNGTASPTPTAYQLRFYKSGVAFSSPQMIEVYSPPAGSPTGTNEFEVVAHIIVLEEAVDPLFCKASGFFIWPDGRPHKGARMHFIYTGSPQMVDARGVVGERVSIITGATGYTSINLIRGAYYRVTVAGEEDTQREITVPDLAAVNIVALLYPTIILVDWAPPVAMLVDDVVVLEPEVYTNTGILLEGTASEDLLYAVDDPEIISVLVSSTSITLTALAPGATTLRVTRRDESIAYVPAPGITGGTTAITVS